MYKPAEVFSSRISDISYMQAIVSAILQAAGCSIEYAEAPSINNIYIRDHFIVSALDPLIIKSEKTKNVNSIIPSIKSSLPACYKALTTKASFVGGNILQVRPDGLELNTVYYGNYGNEKGRDIFTLSMFKGLPSTLGANEFIDELNERKVKSKSDALARTTFKILALNNQGSESVQKTWNQYYYHLDCFMTFIPNGKVIILNKNMLKPGSYSDLVSTLGEENIIDLKYDYLRQPVTFNLVVIPLEEKQFLLFGPSLPEEILSKLESHGYYLLTPESLNSAHFRFNAELARQVSETLQAAGWDVTIDTLVSAIPGYRTHYSLEHIRKVVALLTSPKAGPIRAFNSLLEDQLPITKSEGMLMLSALEQFIPGLGANKAIKTDGSESAKLKWFLQLIQEKNPLIHFNFDEFDQSEGISKTIPLHFTGNKQPVSLICDEASVHCMVQECPTTIDGHLQLFSPARPLFLVRNDFVLLKKYQAQTERGLPNINTVLRRAVVQGNYTDIKRAITCGAEVNSQDPRRGYTALHWACDKKYVDIIRYLISQGAQSNIQTYEAPRRTPFDLLLDIYSDEMLKREECGRLSASMMDGIATSADRVAVTPPRIRLDSSTSGVTIGDIERQEQNASNVVNL